MNASKSFRTAILSFFIIISITSLSFSYDYDTDGDTDGSDLFHFISHISGSVDLTALHDLAASMGIPKVTGDQSIAYTYDRSNRLEKVSYSNGTVIDYIYDACGNRLCETVSLKTTPANNSPYQASNPFPADNQSNVNVEPVLAWTCSDPDAQNILFYDIYFGLTNPPPLVRPSQTDSNFTPGRLNSMQTYYWKIVSKDNRLETTPGPVWHFSTANTQPEIPTYSLPSDLAEIEHRHVVFQWNCSDPDPDDTLTFDLYLGKSASPGIFKSDIPVDHFEVDYLEPNTQYFWKIVARDNHGSTQPGAVWSFTTGDRQPWIMENITLTDDATFPQEYGPYIINGSLTVNNGTAVTIGNNSIFTISKNASIIVNGELQINPGAILKFNTDAYLTVNGCLRAQGLDSDKIIFTSYKDDEFGGDTNGDGGATGPANGDWGYIYFAQTSENSLIDHALIRFGGAKKDQISIFDAVVNIENTIIQNSKSRGINIYINTSAPTIRNCIVTANNSYGISSNGGATTIENNTIYGNGFTNLDLSTHVNATITNNIIDAPIRVAGDGPIVFSGNQINCNNSFPLEIEADFIDELLNNNTLNNLDSESYLKTYGNVTQDAVWPNTMPFSVISDIYINGTDGSDNITLLTLEPGCELRFNNGCKLAIANNNQGALNASGTPAAPIVFTLAEGASGTWNGIECGEYTTAMTMMAHCIIEHAETAFYLSHASPVIKFCQISQTLYGGIWIEQGSPDISNNTFNNNPYGVYILEGNPTINANNFNGNYNYDVYFVNTATGSLSGNTFDNGFYASKVDRVTPLVIESNTVSYNNSYPIVLDADYIGSFLAANVLTNLDSDSVIIPDNYYLTKDAIWPAVLPYYIKSDIHIQGTDGSDGVTTLTLAPGTELRFNYTGISVSQGALVADGTESQPITFTSAKTSKNAGDWNDITFYSTMATSMTKFNYCIVKYSTNGLVLDHTSPVITHSIFSNNYFQGIFMKSGSATITNCTITDNDYGININSNPSGPVIRYNDIFDNTTFGISNNSSSTINAQYNYWGDPSGPYHPTTNPSGSGDPVSDHIDYNPWATTLNN